LEGRIGRQPAIACLFEDQPQSRLRGPGLGRWRGRGLSLSVAVKRLFRVEVGLRKVHATGIDLLTGPAEAVAEEQLEAWQDVTDISSRRILDQLGSKPLQDRGRD